MKPYVLFLTGAGISASAGIATYRDGGSSWVDSDLEKKSHATRYGNHLDELWDKHWGPMQKQMGMVAHTPAHMYIAEFQKQHDSIVATQNIDFLHERAGSDNIVHIHGDMTVRCMKCKANIITEWTGKGSPECPNCNYHKTRPDVILFGEQLNKKTFKALELVADQSSHIIAVGTSLNVFPAATLVMDRLSAKDTKTIFVNKEEVPMTKFFTEKHIGLADELLPDVLNKVHQERT